MLAINYLGTLSEVPGGSIAESRSSYLNPHAGLRESSKKTLWGS